MRHTRTRLLNLITCGILAAPALAAAQTSVIERNFQRLDHVRYQASKIRHFTETTHPARTDVSFWQLAASATLPDPNRSFSGSLVYVDSPLALVKGSEGLHTFQGSVSLTQSDPGPTSNQGGETVTYQLTRDFEGAITPGLSSGYTDKHNYSVQPFVSASAMTGDKQWVLTPTLTYNSTTAAGLHQDAAIPDVMLSYSPAGAPLLGFAADYVAGTRIAGNSLVVTGKYSFTSDPGSSSLKVGVAATAKAIPTFSIQLAVKL